MDKIIPLTTLFACADMLLKGLYIWLYFYFYEDGSKTFRPDIEKPRQMENAVRDT